MFCTATDVLLTNKECNAGERGGCVSARDGQKEQREALDEDDKRGGQSTLGGRSGACAPITYHGDDVTREEDARTREDQGNGADTVCQMKE